MNRQLLKKFLRPGYKLLERNVLDPMRLGAFDRAGKEEFQIFLKYAMNYVFGCQIQGDYLEFGSFRGNTLTTAFLSAKRFGLNSMRFFIFDSFEGLPERWSGSLGAGAFDAGGNIPECRTFFANGSLR